MHSIYWIKKKDHHDILTQGYVGYSISPDKRFETHKISKSVVGNNIRKHEDHIEMIIVEQFKTAEEALRKEKQLRPRKRIGWNVAIGGQIPPDNKNNKDVKRKISETLKRLGVNPYSEKTHSEESIKKAMATKKKANRRMYHDPISGDYKFIAIGLGEPIPDGWLPGRVKKKQQVKKIRGIDYVCNTKRVIVVDPSGNTHEVVNLKQWCEINGIPYLASCKNKSWKGWKVV